jgi:hypothetical protein
MLVKPNVVGRYLQYKSILWKTIKINNRHAASGRMVQFQCFVQAFQERSSIQK